MRRFALVAVLLLAVSTPSGTARAAEFDARITRQLHTNADRYGIAGQAVRCLRRPSPERATSPRTNQ